MATNLCEKLISGCISASCDNPIYDGMEQYAYIFNKSEIASFTYDATNSNIITAINMKTDDNDTAYTGYQILNLGKTPYTGTQTEMAEGNTANTFTETFQFLVPDNSPTASMLLDSLANGKYVIVAENSYEGSDSKGKFQVYGAKKGLVASSMTRSAYDDENDSAWVCTFTSEKVPNAALFLYHETDSTEDTASYIESLTSCE